MRKAHLILVSLLLSFAAKATNDIPRPEYPRPQFERTDWVNLNGAWTYEFDFDNSGEKRNLPTTNGLSKTIIVPFCPESKLSGVNYANFIKRMWYQRSLTIPADWSNKKVLLHFGAVDYAASIFIDGRQVGFHQGGSSPFSIDITHITQPGKTHNLVVSVSDDINSGLQGSGKQSANVNSYACFYTRVTGIWQTVWMEAVSPYGLKAVVTNPDIDQKQLVITPQFYQISDDQTLEVTMYDGKKKVAKLTSNCANGNNLILPVKKMKLWSPETPHLYDIIYRVKDAKGQVIDEVKSYVGMRKVHTANGQFYLNNEPYFQRLIMNQGYYPDGIWTAPTDETLKNDIVLSKAVGFNGARLHQKVFEERFHYWADKLGFITWGEFPNWGMSSSNELASRNFLSEWIEVVERDRNHPSIITWGPFNNPMDIIGGIPLPFVRLVFDTHKLTKAIDPSRPFNDMGSNFHFLTDIWSISNYESDATRFALGLKPNKNQHSYTNQPLIISEFGGMVWDISDTNNRTWGHGEMISNEDALYERLEKQVNAIQAAGNVTGFCYTQLNDIEQEKNGIYTYDRSAKLDTVRIKAIFEKIPSRPVKK
ncbi:glycoside hydrolase family 2 protein [Bacteroides sp.]|uniref:glycoside hydrolase family 2 protein n=1 Tax=Bacteroides sp. TaxID=29523 RepID=UPI00263616E2|nr:sugar-binding domain-containing protein [Bacteroides sp.]MDD3039358.1 glycoside hydrolase family 2 TIM barrel-domain containing protein [Bacteroides sp.]